MLTIVGKLLAPLADSHVRTTFFVGLAYVLAVFGWHVDATAAAEVAGPLIAVVLTHAAKSPPNYNLSSLPQATARGTQKGSALVELVMPLAIIGFAAGAATLHACGANGAAIRAGESKCLATDGAMLAAKLAACRQAQQPVGSDIVCSGLALLTSGELTCAIEALGDQAGSGS